MCPEPLTLREAAVNNVITSAAAAASNALSLCCDGCSMPEASSHDGGGSGLASPNTKGESVTTDSAGGMKILGVRLLFNLATVSPPSHRGHIAWPLQRLQSSSWISFGKARYRRTGGQRVYSS
eukprot:RCo020153